MNKCKWHMQNQINFYIMRLLSTALQSYLTLVLAQNMKDCWQCNASYVKIGQSQNTVLIAVFVCAPFICSFKNGSLTRERIRDVCAEGSWKLFNELLNSTPRGNFGNIGKFRRYNVSFACSCTPFVICSWHQTWKNLEQFTLFLCHTHFSYSESKVLVYE